MKKELLIPSALALVITASSVAPALASSDRDRSGDDDSRRGGFRLQSDDNNRGGWFNGWFKGKHRGELKLEVSGSLENRLAKIIARYDENKDKHLRAYTKLQTDLANFETRVEAAGYNTDDLEAHLVVFDGLVAKFKADYALYIDALRVAHTMTTNGSTDEQIDAQLQIAKDKLLVAKASGVAARDYFKGTIKADVKALKMQVKADANALLNIVQ